MRKYDMVVFDMAGTTVMEGKTVYISVKEALEKSGINFDLEKIIEFIGGLDKLSGIELLLKNSGNNYKKSKAHEVHELFLDIVNKNYSKPNSLSEMEGASFIFQELKNAGIKVCLDTGYHRKTADIILNQLQWKKNNLIDFSVTSDEVPEGRPHPYMIMKAMAKYDIVDPERIVKVGDTVSDIQEGKNTGCGLIISIDSGTQPRQKLEENNPDYIVSSLKEVLPLIL